MKVNEIFYSVQGEGRHAGVPMVFIRLTGCNLHCNFCDTEYAFENSKQLSELEIVAAVKSYKPNWVCITGGEPFLQNIEPLVDLLKADGFKVHIETNGTIHLPVDCDWLVVSPKAEKMPSVSMLKQAQEIKVVVTSQESFANLKQFEEYGAHLSIQAVDNNRELVNLCVDFVKANPNWCLSLQIHKLIDIP